MKLQKTLIQIATSLMLCVGGVLVSPEVHADVLTVEPYSDWVPIPWGVPQEFPWVGVQGTWRSYQSHPDWIFSLKVTYQKNKLGNLLVIKVIDPKTCHVIARGTGYERNKVVLGQLTSKYGTLRVTLGSFEPALAKRQTAGLYVDGVFAVSITKLKETRPMVELQIVKESPQDVSARFCPQDR